MAKPDIQDNIAKLLMHSSVGLTENAVIQQVTSTTNVKAITSALIRMQRFGYIKETGKRWEITPTGRAFYSELNMGTSTANTESDIAPATATETATTELPGIEYVQACRTSDGQLHPTQSDAERHQLKQQLLPSIDDFIKQMGSGARQQGLIRHYIIHWEQFKKDRAA